MLKRREVMECPVPQFGDDRCRDVANGAFRSRFLLRFLDAGGHDCSDIVVAHSLIRVREDDLAVLWMFDYTGLEIITHCPCRDAAKVLIHVDVAPDPGIHLHVECGFDIGVTAVG